ncbi:MAG TPA: hypothetical protein PK629_02885 [Oscillospiraceae bacterium]|nr:hypothetical protein [Oscillospiraceae bacterium]HPK34272.1 hypothetical protein [Oscillospiraceae bacterium]HPR74825.1 hypothetical protein [Oscillospiraceae bacterium]
MKKGDISSWKNVDQCMNLLFFAQLVNELLFDYSIPSNRISTLNSHFLCYDAINAINAIENKGVPEGTLRPIIEELYNSLNKDTLFALLNESPLDFFVKYNNKKYQKIYNTNELNFNDSKIIIKALNDKFFSKNSYYENLMNEIIKIIIDNNVEKQNDLFKLTKSILTELVNLRYSPAFIYEYTNKYFFRKKNIEDPRQIIDYFSIFTFKPNNYSVIFIIDNKVAEFIEHFDGLNCEDSFNPKTTLNIEKNFLKKRKYETYLNIDAKSLDPYKAVEYAKRNLEINLSFYKLSDHYLQFNITNMNCGVYDDSNHFTLVLKNNNAVQKAKTPNKDIINKNMGVIEKTQESADFSALISAVLFHSLSLDSVSEKNQLLDLWVIFETLLNINSKHASDRIDQICVYLVPILKRKYLYSLFLQLTNDLKMYSNSEYKKIIKDKTDEFEIVQQICEFVILDEKKLDRKRFLDSCFDFPLLKERIQYYNNMLATVDKVYKFVEKHSDRVKWQLMRIYRNRNLIIHNGKTMPYLKLLVENLHAYTDDFLNYTIQSLSNGHSVNSMCQELFKNECDWISEFNNKKQPMTSKLIKKILSL